MPMEQSHIWLAKFPTEDALDAYFKEVYDDEDEIPINRFAADQGERFYDRDWLERGFSDSGSLEQLIHGHSYCEAYLDKVIAAAAAQGIANANTFILADQAEFSDPKPVKGVDYTLWYLGRYRCWG